MDDSFRLVIYRACQRAELALITPRHKSYMRTIPVLGSDGRKTAHDGPGLKPKSSCSRITFSDIRYI